MRQQDTPPSLPPRQLSGAPVESPLPTPRPERSPLVGRYARLEPVEPDRHADTLYQAGHVGVGTDEIWDYMAYGPFESADHFTGWLRDRADSEDPLFFAVIDQSRGRAEGMASFMDIQPQTGGIELGHIWFGPSLQRGRAATEALYLMMTHVVDDLGYRRLQWKCNALNRASRTAAIRLGYAFEGVLYQHQVPKGHNRDTAYYSILDYEWPLIRENFERWLRPENFDDAGRQQESLGDLNRALRPESG